MVSNDLNSDAGRDADALLAELQRAADEHRLILERQSALIQRLRQELRESRDQPR